MKYLLGYDASGLEARTQAHYVQPYKGGDALVYELLEGDVHCYSGDTELLTDRGWKRLDDFTEVSKVMQYNQNNGELTFTDYRYLHFQQESQCLEFSRSSMFVTCDHRCLVQSSKSGKFSEHLAKNLPTTNGDVRHVSAGIYNQTSALSQLECRLLVAIQADGSITPHNAVRFEFKKQKKIHRLQQLLDMLQLKYSIYPGKGGSTTRINVHKQEKLAIVLLQLGPNKIIPYLGVNGRWIIDEIGHWDGTVKPNGSVTLDSTCKESVENLHTLASISGYKVSRLRSYNKTTTYGKCKVYRLNVNPNAKPHISVLADKLPKLKTLKSVYCVQVPTSWVLTRRKGQVIVSGNSKNAEVFGTDRDGAKGPYYGLMYGCQPPKLASMLGIPKAKATEIFDDFWESMPPLKAFKEDTIKEWRQNNKKWITAIDGRVIFTRSEHSLVNAKFQSCGSIAMRLSACLMDRWLQKYDTKVSKVIDYHDEAQLEVDESLVYEKDGQLYSDIGDLAIKSIEKAGQILKLNVPLTGEYLLGKSWADCH